MTVEISGVMPPLVTPFTDDQDIDEEATRHEIEYMIEAGVHGIVLGGSSGEGEKLAVEEVCRLAEIAVDQVGGRVPVIAGVIEDSTRAAIRRGKALKDTGVDALQVTTVHYLHWPDEAGTLRYFDEIGQAVELPIVLYNVVPWNMIEVPTIMKMADHGRVVAVKQSGGDILKLADLVERVHATGSNLRVMSAIDALLFPTFLMGAHGTIGFTASVLPRLTLALWDACQSGEVERARELHERMLPVVLLWQACTTDQESAMKAAIEVQGRQVGPPRSPALPVTGDLRARIEQVVEASGEPDLVRARA
jgi:4-hydroxy-tetrahydrodipicolinate synthase